MLSIRAHPVRHLHVGPIGPAPAPARCAIGSLRDQFAAEGGTTEEEIMKYALLLMGT
ncbi:hypothetical protein GCM10027033_19020 [Leucobacter ruminantium]